ncbi:MAG: hypothetical protein AB1403_00935 [Candidatus Riflebacteria bacterium]
MPRFFLSILAIFLLTTFSVAAKSGETWLNINVKSGLPSNNLTCMAITEGKMAVGSDKGIGLFLENDTRWHNLNQYAEELGNLAIRSIDFDSYGNIWAATPNGIFSIEIEKFPEEPPIINNYNTENGLSTIDTEVLQIVDDNLYVGCFGGWLFKANIFQKAVGIMFTPVNSGGMGYDDEHKIMSVGITALAMDFPGGGIFSTKGRGLLQAIDGTDYCNDELPTDWVNDFWSFSDGNSNRVIAVMQGNMSLIENHQLKGEAGLPIDDCWISCLTTAPDEEREAMNVVVKDHDRYLNEFLGKRLLYVGTQGKGLWKFDEGRWFNYTCRDCPLPSDNINRVYYLPGSKKIAILTDAGLTLFGLTEEMQYDEFEHRGSTPFFAKTFWPFMSQWGPYVYGYPSQKCYPIEPFITYKKLVRGKDLWVSHQKGLSRFAFPSAPFLGILGFRHLLSGRFENPKGDPATNNQIEDDSVVVDKPPAAEGERLWHHYCQEQPQDFSEAPLSEIFSSRDMKTLAGPLNRVKISVESIDDYNPQDHARTIANASQTMCYPPVITLETPRGLFDTSGRELLSIASQMADCPLHPIPSTEITDFCLDFNERCWVIFEKSRISVLNSTDYSGGLSFGVTHGHEWTDVSELQVPWPKDDELLCVRGIGGNIYVGTKASGMYLLPAAHGVEIEAMNAEMWRHVDVSDDNNRSETTELVKEIAYWNTSEGEMVALLHEQSLSIYDGQNLTKIPVPERRYTCMIADRKNRLWLGAMTGLLYLDPGMKIHDIQTDPGVFESDCIVSIAAAPDDAKYPYVIGLSYDQQFHPDAPKHLKTSDVPPMLSPDPTNPYRLRVKNPEIMGSRVLLWDEKRWEKLSRPGVHDLMFDQRFLWTATSNRIMRLYLPVEQVPY